MDEARASVEAALEMLQEETAALVEAARAQGAEAYACGDTSGFERIDGQTKRFEAFAEQVGALAAQWRGLGKRRKRRSDTGTSRPRRGELIPEKEYVLPILQILHDAGGSAPIGDVKEALERMMGQRFGPRERELLKGGEVRWENRAQWVRFALVKGGMMASGSKHGIWEITPEGEALLRSGDVDAVWPKLLEAKGRRRR